MKLNINRSPTEIPLNFMVVAYRFNWARERIGTESKEPISFQSVEEMRSYIENLTTINSQLFREAKKNKAKFFLEKRLETK